MTTHENAERIREAVAEMARLKAERVPVRLCQICGAECPKCRQHCCSDRCWQQLSALWDCAPAMLEALRVIGEGNTQAGKGSFTHADVIQSHCAIVRRVLALLASKGVK